MHLLIRFFITAIVLGLVISFVPGFHNNIGATGPAAFGPFTIFILAVIFGACNMFVGPILRLLGAPINWVTHGLFTIVINWVLLALAVYLTPNVRAGWIPTLLGAVIVTLISTAVTMLTKDKSETTPA